MRHRLVHGYYKIDLDIVWKTLQEDLPPLIASLEKILGRK
ncbi:MAG: HepT-like ribonuclease domain-containing protein [Planctomycetota bacterium]|nr:HepT-like ribonuclease domain-containing protein [Planctomycetota bacterium]